MCSGYELVGGPRFCNNDGNWENSPSCSPAGCGGGIIPNAEAGGCTNAVLTTGQTCNFICSDGYVLRNAGQIYGERTADAARTGGAPFIPCLCASNGNAEHLADAMYSVACALFQAWPLLAGAGTVTCRACNIAWHNLAARTIHPSCSQPRIRWATRWWAQVDEARAAMSHQATIAK